MAISSKITSEFTFYPCNPISRNLFQRYNDKDSTRVMLFFVIIIVTIYKSIQYIEMYTLYIKYLYIKYIKYTLKF